MQLELYLVCSSWCACVYRIDGRLARGIEFYYLIRFRATDLSIPIYPLITFMCCCLLFKSSSKCVYMLTVVLYLGLVATRVGFAPEDFIEPYSQHKR